MRILILGGTGMLGHRLWMDLSPSHETHVAVRGRGEQVPVRQELPRGLLHEEVDAASFVRVAETIHRVRPDVVVNCVGVVKQSPLAIDPIASLELNSLLPHRLAQACQANECRLIQLSTDCVFSGERGFYSEKDRPDPVDLYGHTKLLGEVTGSGCLTLRTSFIGRELRDRRGLLEWFLAQTQTIRGYSKAIFSGLTNLELSRILLELVLPREDLQGLYHVAGLAISKHDLLRLLREAYGKQTEIIPDSSFVCDRSLDGRNFANATGYRAPDWPVLVEELARTSDFYDVAERQGDGRDMGAAFQ